MLGTNGNRPDTQAAAPTTGAAAESPAGGSNSPLPGVAPVRILLVDDEMRNLDVLESILHSPDLELVRALNADQALMLLLTGEFAVIVLDIQMPDMSGIDLAKLIKKRRRTQHIPIVFLTAYYHEDEDVLVGYGSGAVDYLTKPINPQILRSKISVFVDLFRKTRLLADSNAALELEIGQRLKAEDALRQANDDLEARVESRTADLMRANNELRASEAALRASEAQSTAASHAKDEFLAALSHELRTPLNPVLLLASHAAADPSLPDEVRAEFETIRKNVELEARLIDDLLDLTRVTRGMLRLDLREIDAHEVVLDAVAIMRPEAMEKGLVLVLDLAAEEHSIRGDVVRLQQVFWNLLKNAVKFTPAGGTVSLESRCGPDNGEWTFTIRDSGIGLTAEELEQIFEAFAQGEHARQPGSHRFGGLGLGLAISRKLVEIHEGRIVAASGGRGKGSEFTVTLPLARTLAPGIEAAPEQTGRPAKPGHRHPERAGPRGQCGHILLVEDHAATRSTLAGLLDRRNYEVVAVGSAAQARLAAAKQTFDLLISDIGLPDGGGCELMESLRASRPGLRGIALSGYGMDDDITRSRQAGFVEHLIKPIAIDALETAIQAAMGGVVSGVKSANPGVGE
jgi:signal transduction histidine kinase